MTSQTLQEKEFEAFYKKDVDELRRLYKENGKLNGAYMFIDTAVEEGNMQMTNFLINEVGVCPSLYGVQMAQINGNYQTSHYALYSCQELRNRVGIETVHYSPKHKKWADVIPENHRYFWSKI
jgi:hypothetical protein